MAIPMEAGLAETYTDLKVWQKSMDLVVEVYRSTRTFPKHELYGLTSQMRRAAVSVPSNIAEAKGRYSTKELVQFLYNARGSLLELQTQIVIAHRLEYLPEMEWNQLHSKPQKSGKC
jgi:four helix bundle protein